MKMVDNVTVAVAIGAIISPVIVAIINDWFTYKLKKKELQLNVSKIHQEQETEHQKLKLEFQTNLQKLVSEYVSSANNCYNLAQVGDWGELVSAKERFDNASAKLFVVLPSKKQKQVLEWLNQSRSRDENEWLNLVTEINEQAPKLLKGVKQK